MASSFQNHFSVIKSKIDREYKDKCKAQVQNFKFSYSIQFDDEDDAQLFHAATGADPAFLTWTDPREGRVYPLRVGWDQ
eukprot:7507505-Pyramimonas_sp.AAC.1